MIFLIFISFIVITSFSFFAFYIKVDTINRAVIYTPLEIFETSIPISQLEENEAYFEKNKIETKLKYYYDTSIKSNYSLSTFYYNQSDNSICVNGKCDAVEVTVEAYITSFYTYHRVMFYEIRWKNG